MKNLPTLLLISCLASLALGCSNTCPCSGGPGDCTNNGDFQPVKIQYSANGICLNVEIGGNGNGNTTPPAKYEKCGSCSAVPYGRVPLFGDCSKFCECIQGKHSKIDSCPDKLEFNANKQMCDYAEDAGCSSVTENTPDTESTPSIQTPDAGNTPSIQTPDAGSTPSIQTPDAGSTPSIQTPETGSTPSIQTPYTDSTPSIQTPDTGSTPNAPDGTNGNCKLCASEPIGKRVPIEGDCTKFCVCQYYNNQESNIVVACPNNSYFNSTWQICDWPENSECIQP